MGESASAATGNMHMPRELREERLPYGIVPTLLSAAPVPLGTACFGALAAVVVDRSAQRLTLCVACWYIRMGPTLVGRPLLLRSVGQITCGQFWRFPVDEGLVVVIVPGLDVADRVAALAEREVIVVGVEVSDDGSVAQFGHGLVPFLHQPDC